MGSGSGLVGEWSQLASLLKKGYLPPTRARACVRVRVSACECACACACVSEGI